MATTYAKVNQQFIQVVEDLTITDSAGANVVTINGTVLNRYMDISDKVVPFEAEITEASAGDGAIDFRLEASLTAAFTVAIVIDSTAGVDLDPTGLNTVSGTLSAVGFWYPYWRVVAFTDATDTVDDSTLDLTVVAPFVNRNLSLLEHTSVR